MIKANTHLIKGSIILLITFNIFNVLNLIYNLAMVRVLSLADYGTLNALINITLIFAIFGESIQTIISKYTSKEKNLSKIKYIIKKSLKKASRMSFVFFIIYLIASIYLSKLLSINYWFMALTGVSIFTFFLIPILRGALQGKKRFLSLGTSMIVEGAVKLIFSIILIVAGFKLSGALVGLLLGSFLALIFSFSGIKDIMSKNEILCKTPSIYNYARPVFMVNLAVILFLTLDIIIAKRFFSAETVGIYSIASAIAKIVFIGTQPIAKAMFPIASESRKKKESKGILNNSIWIMSLIILLALILTYFVPNFLVFIYSGKYVQEAINILFNLTLAMSALALANLVLFYKLSKESTKNYWFLGAFIIIQVALLSLFNSTLLEFSMSLLVSAVIFLMGSLLLIRK